MDLEDAALEQDAKRGAAEKAAAHARALAVVPASTLQKGGEPTTAATRYKWFYPNRVGRAPYTFVDVGHRYLQKSDTIKEEKSRQLSEAKVKTEDHRLQYDVALEARQLRVSLQGGKEELALKSKSARIRDKRQDKAKREVALAHSKVANVDITL